MEGLKKPVPPSPLKRRSKRVLLIALAALPLCGMGGCVPSPELAVYRAGLHAVDEPLYQAHLQLMDDAVAAGLRSEADRQTVRAGIKAARQLYEESRKPAQ